MKTSRSEFLHLPMKERRKILREQTDKFIASGTMEDLWEDEKPKDGLHLEWKIVCQILDTLDKLSLALASQNHQWSRDERSSYERALRILTPK